MDGVVNADDYFRIDIGWMAHLTGWYNGDFDYDNAVTADDYFIIDRSYLGQGLPKPPMTVSGEAAVDEGTPYTLTLDALTKREEWLEWYDFDTDQTMAGWVLMGAYDTIGSWTVNWGDGESATLTSESVASEPEAGVSLTSSRALAEHVYEDDGTYTITVSGKGEDLNRWAGTKTLAVNNVPPTLDIGGMPTADNEAEYALDLLWFDAGDDAGAWTINWGDGSPTQAVDWDVDGAYHTFANPTGAHDLILTATDDDGTYVLHETIPAAPSALTASAVSGTQVNLAWSDNSAQETGFAVECSTDGASYSVWDLVGPDVCQYSMTGLDPSTTYQFRVRAYSRLASWASNSASVATSSFLFGQPGDPQHGAPSDLIGTVSSTGKRSDPLRLDLSWTDNSDGEDGFSIEYLGDGVDFWQLDTVQENQTTFSYSAYYLVDDFYIGYRDRLWFRVKAYAGGEESWPSNTVELLCPPGPLALWRDGNTSTTMDLSWSAQGTELVYDLGRSPDGFTWQRMVTGTSACSYHDSGLLPETCYSYRVRARNSAGTSEFDILETATYPTAPVGLAVTIDADTMMHLTWTNTSPNWDGYVIQTRDASYTWEEALDPENRPYRLGETPVPSGAHEWYAFPPLPVDGDDPFTLRMVPFALRNEAHPEQFIGAYPTVSLTSDWPSPYPGLEDPSYYGSPSFDHPPVEIIEGEVGSVWFEGPGEDWPETVYYEIRGTAQYPADYTLQVKYQDGTVQSVAPGQVTIPPYNGHVTLNILPTNDAVVEEPECLVVYATDEDGWAYTFAQVTIGDPPSAADLVAHRTGNRFGEVVPESAEDDAGQFVVFVNDDDDVTPGIADNDNMQGPAIPAPGMAAVDDDLVRVTLASGPVSTWDRLSISTTGPIEVLTDSLASCRPAELGSPGPDIWVQGLEPGTATISVVYYNFRGQVYRDTINLTVVKPRWFSANGWETDADLTLMVPTWQLLAFANGVADTPPIDPAAKFKMHIEGLPANVANTVRVSSSLVPGEWYTDEPSPSSPDFESACWSVIYEADADETLTAEAKALIKQSLGINAVCATELTTTIQTCGGDSQTAHFGSPRLIRVDTNRDGVISFDGTKDLTSFQSPYCFWLNDNWDRYNGKYDDYEELKPRRFGNDASDDQIGNARDLQDFSRIRIKPPPGYDAFGVAWSVKLRLENNNDTLALRLFDVSQDQADKYLTDITAEGALSGKRFGIKLTAGSTRDVSFQFNSWTKIQGFADFLFEGISAGDGQLVVEFYKDSVLVAQDAVDLQLRSVEEMYDTFDVNNAATENNGRELAPAQIPSTYRHVFSAYNSYSPQTDDYILFVHGWRMQAWDKAVFANTAYKRLFWQGYNGRFGTFDWPTEWIDTEGMGLTSLEEIWGLLTRSASVARNFCNSEQKAWTSAQALHSLLVDLYNKYHTDSGDSTVRLLAHSMGNIVASEALRWEMHQETEPTRKLVHTYVASQAATWSEALDGKGNWQNAQQCDLYKYYNDNGGPYFQGLTGADGSAGRMINFYNPVDYALGKEVLMARLMKPQPECHWIKLPGSRIVLFCTPIAV